MCRQRIGVSPPAREMHMNGLARLAAALAVSVASTTVFAQSSISIEQPWARATPHGAATAAAYMTIENHSDSEDRLVSAASPLADKLQVHEMSMTNGIMKMREVLGGLVVPAHGSVTLSPGRYHMMMIGVKHGLNKGDDIPVTLTFQKGGSVAASVPVLSIAASGPRAATSAHALSNGMGGAGGMGDMGGRK
jgi:copper(I)-binding protein